MTNWVLKYLVITQGDSETTWNVELHTDQGEGHFDNVELVTTTFTGTKEELFKHFSDSEGYERVTPDDEPQHEFLLRNE